MEPLKSQDPKSIGQWKLIGRLGSGGMGIVYLAEKNIQRVALKVVQNFMDSPEIRARLQREVELMGKIKSDRVAKVIDSDVEDEFAWIATEFIDGPDLKTYVESNGVLNEEDWIGLSLGIFQGLKDIHAEGVIHRDIKPSNILISNKGPILIDFGIAQGSDSTSLTSTGLVAGSPAWLSPEQIHGTPLTNATDLFSAGSVLHFAGSGISPWGEQTSATTPVVFNRILKGKPILSSLTENQKSLILKLLEKNPQKRISANQVLDFLNKQLQNKSTSIIKENFKPKILKSTKKTKISLIAAIAVGVVVSGVIGAFNQFGTESKIETTTANQSKVIQTPTPVPTVTKEKEIRAAETESKTNIENSGTEDKTELKSTREMCIAYYRARDVMYYDDDRIKKAALELQNSLDSSNTVFYKPIKKLSDKLNNWLNLFESGEWQFYFHEEKQKMTTAFANYDGCDEKYWLS
jgi:serine/threonine protein kinase